MFRFTPRIVATVRADGTGEVSINGRSIPLDSGDLQQVGAQAVRFVAQRAAAAGHPLRMTAQAPYDTRQVMVHPDGRLTEVKDRQPFGRYLVAGGFVLLCLGLAAWLWLVPWLRGNQTQPPNQALAAPEYSSSFAVSSEPAKPASPMPQLPWAEPTAEPTAEQTGEPTAEQTGEPTAEQTLEPAPAWPNSEQATEQANEPPPVQTPLQPTPVPTSPTPDDQRTPGESESSPKASHGPTTTRPTKSAKKKAKTKRVPSAPKPVQTGSPKRKPKVSFLDG